MQGKTIEEKAITPKSGGTMLFLLIICLLISVAVFVFSVICITSGEGVLGGVLMAVGIIGWALISILRPDLKLSNPMKPEC